MQLTDDEWDMLKQAESAASDGVRCYEPDGYRVATSLEAKGLVLLGFCSHAQTAIVLLLEKGRRALVKAGFCKEE